MSVPASQSVVLCFRSTAIFLQDSDYFAFTILWCHDVWLWCCSGHLASVSWLTPKYFWVSGGCIWLAYDHFTYAGSKIVHTDSKNIPMIFFSYEIFILGRPQISPLSEVFSDIILSLNCWARVKKLKCLCLPTFSSLFIHFSSIVNFTKAENQGYLHKNTWTPNFFGTIAICVSLAASCYVWIH